MAASAIDQRRTVSTGMTWQAADHSATLTVWFIYDFEHP
jgi:hypothetical protein